MSQHFDLILTTIIVSGCLIHLLRTVIHRPHQGQPENDLKKSPCTSCSCQNK